MTAAAPVSASDKTVPATSLGAPGPLDPVACSRVAIEALTLSAGAGLWLASFSLEMGPGVATASDQAVLRVAVDKRTRVIAFLTLEAVVGDRVAFTARGVFTGRG